MGRTGGVMHTTRGTTWHGIGGGGEKPFFNTYDRSIAGRDHEWVKDALTVKVAMFHRMGM